MWSITTIPSSTRTRSIIPPINITSIPIPQRFVETKKPLLRTTYRTIALFTSLNNIATNTILRITILRIGRKLSRKCLPANRKVKTNTYTTVDIKQILIPPKV